MTKVLLGAGLAAALLAGTALSAQAATNQGSLGTFDDTGVANTSFTIGTPNTPFDYLYTFTLSVDGFVSASATNAYTITPAVPARPGRPAVPSTSSRISDFNIIVDGTPGVTGDLLNTQISSYPPTSSLVLFSPGTYTLDVVGTSGSSPGGSSVGVSFSFSAAPTMSTVPLPSSVGLFGAAVAGLGVVGAARRKSKTVTA